SRVGRTGTACRLLLVSTCLSWLDNNRTLGVLDYRGTGNRFHESLIGPVAGGRGRRVARRRRRDHSDNPPAHKEWYAGRPPVSWRDLRSVRRFLRASGAAGRTTTTPPFPRNVPSHVLPTKNRATAPAAPTSANARSRVAR